MAKKKLVVLSGAGISAESGLKTFRDGDGLWENYRPEEVASPEAWAQDPGRVLRFYNERRAQVLAAVPNAAHVGLAALEAYYEVIIVTQNIDDLHERAGSKHVLHLHGEILKMKSERPSDWLQEIRGAIHLGDRAPDGAQLRPHVVWFGEAVPQMEAAIPHMETADVFILVGSSLAVYPAANLIDFVAEEVPKYLVDPAIPPISYGRNFYRIEQKATVGIPYLVELLSKA